MTSSTGREGRLLLLGILGGGIGVTVLLLSFLVQVYGVFRVAFSDVPLDPVAGRDAFILAADLGLMAAIPLMASLLTFQRLRGRSVPSDSKRGVRARLVIALVALWILSVAGVWRASSSQGWASMLALLQVPAIALPLYLMVRLLIGGMQGGTSLRFWGSASSGLILSAGIAIALELVLLIVAALAGALVLMRSPELTTQLLDLMAQAEQGAQAKNLLPELQSWISSPRLLMALLIGMGAFIPIIEESSKSAAPWLIYDRLKSPADGFWCGALSGAGFALFEGLTATMTPTDYWPLILVLRAGGSLMHIVASALAGWGIASFRQGRRLSRLLGGYGMAVLLHAAWNASVVLMAYASVRAAAAAEHWDAVGVILATLGGAGFIGILIVLPLLAASMNRALRAEVPGSDGTSDHDAPAAVVFGT